MCVCLIYNINIKKRKRKVAKKDHFYNTCVQAIKLQRTQKH